MDHWHYRMFQPGGPLSVGVHLIKALVASELPAAFATKEAELACTEMLIFEAKWRVRAFQSLPRSPNAQKKTKELYVRNNSHRKASAHFQKLR